MGPLRFFSVVFVCLFASCYLLAGAIPGHQGLPLTFEPNHGQVAASARFVARTAEGKIMLEQDGIRAHLGSRGLNFHMRFENVHRLAETLGEAPTGGVANYYYGQDRTKWIEDVPLFKQAFFRDLYQNIDVKYHGREGRLEYDFEVHPGADPSQIVLAFPEADSVRIAEGGDLLVRYGKEEVRLLAPIAFQLFGEVQKKVAVSYTQKNAKSVGFHVSGFDGKRELLIDPVVVFTRAIPVNNRTEVSAIVLDSSSAIYVAGRTYADDYPATIGSSSSNLGQTVYLTKFDPTGENIVYSNEFGLGWANTLSLDASDNAYVTGYTINSGFPTTSSNFGTCGSNCDTGFAVKFDTSGHIVYSTLLSTGHVVPYAAKVDSSGRLLMAGYADSSLQTVNAMYSTGPGGFFLRMNATATAFDFASFYGSGWPTALDTDVAGNIYLAGSGKVPLVNPVSDAGDGYVSEISGDGQTILASTQIGGGGESIVGLKVGSDNTVYIAGTTQAGDYPYTMNAFRLPNVPPTSPYAPNNSFATALKPGLSGLVYSTYLAQATAHTMTLDASGGIYVAGYLYRGSIPLLNPIVSDTVIGSYITALDKTGAVTWSTEFGGINGEQDIYGIAVDGSNNVYVAGSNTNTQQILNGINDPVNVGTGIDYSRQSQVELTNYGSFIAKISPANQPQISLSYWVPFLALRNAGSAPLTLSSISGTAVVNNCGTGLSGGDSCILYVPQSETVTITSNAQPGSQSFTPGDTGISPLVVLSSKPTALRFPPQRSNTTSATKSVVITNVTPLPVSSLSVATSGEVTQTNDCPNILPAESSCTIQVTVTPVTYGGGSIILNFKGATGFNLTSSITVGAAVNAFSDDEFAVSASSLAFGTTVNPDTSLMKVVSITNQTNTTTSAPALSISGDSEFAIVANTCTGTLAPYQGCAVGVQFTPTTNGTPIASLNVPGHSLPVALSATGRLKSAVSVNPLQLDMGLVYVGVPSQSAPLTLTNTSASAIQITGFALGRAEYSEFNNCAGSIAAGASCMVTVSLLPQEAGVLDTLLTISFDSTTTQTIPIHANAMVPVTVTPASVDFGSSTMVGSDSPAQGVSLGNYSPAQIGFTLAVTGPFTISTPNCSNPIEGHSGCVVAVVFHPVTVGANQTGDLAVSIAGVSQAVHVALTGGSISAGLQLSPTSIDFGTTDVNTSLSMPITLTNNQNFVLNIPQPQITGATDQYRLSDNCTVIQPGTTCIVSVAFAPTKVGVQSATLNFENGGSPLGHIPVTLTGTGYPMPGFTISENFYNFGTLDVGRQMTHTLTFRNSAPISLALPAISVSGTGASSYKALSDATCADVPSLGTCNVAVVFAPTAVGPADLTLTLSSGASNPVTLEFDANGIGNDFAFSSGSTTATATATATGATFTVSLASTAPYSGSLNLTCTADSATSYGPCTLSQTSVTLPAQVTATVTKSTHAQNRSPLVWPFALASLLLPLGLVISNRRSLRVILGIAAAATVLAMASCGGGGGGSSTPPITTPNYTTYTYTLTATNPTTNISHSTKLTLQAQQ